MGLDFVEIMCSIDDKFFIELDEYDIDLMFGNKEYQSKKSRWEITQEINQRLTVRFLCDLVEQKIREKNRGIDFFPNTLQEVSDSARETLAEKFNITDTTQITDDLSLSRLADFSASPIPCNFWQQLRKIQKDDTDELKMIKSYIISREYISAFKTLMLSVAISLGFMFLLSFLPTMSLSIWNEDTILAVLFAPSVILFGRRAILNWIRRNKKSKIKVTEIINHIVKQKHKHSVRPDGQPYTRKEIEQGIAEILCDILGVKPKKITPDARLTKDLGMN
jgi:acyl carrier protein